jgi:hypothetical protein
MNVIKTLSELGRPAVTWGPLLFDRISSEAGSRYFPRFAELFSLWLLEHSDKVMPDAFAHKIALLTCDHLHDSAEENRLSCLGLLSALITRRWNIIASRQTALLGPLMNNRENESGLEKQTKLSLINDFITASQQSGTGIDDGLMTSCWEYLRTFANADSAELKLMAYNCILEIERLRNK